MDCLKGYISLTTCGDDVSTSGLSFNSLEIINKDLISSISDNDQETLENCLSDIETRAILRITDDIRSEFLKKKRLKNILSQYNLRHDFLSLTNNVADSYLLKGIYVSSNESLSSLHDPLKSIFIQQFEYFADVNDNGVTTTIYIFDLDSNEILYQKQVTLNTGWNKFDLEINLSGNGYSNAQKIFIALDATNLTYYNKTIQNSICDANYGGLNVYGAKTIKQYNQNISKNDLEITDDTFGCNIIVALKCSFESLICQNKSLFKRAYLYALGIEAMRELISSDRINDYTTLNRNEAQENIKLWKEDYDNSLMNAIDGINIEDGDCTECHNTLMIKTAKGFYGV